VFCVQRFADILAAEADKQNVEVELVDLSNCEPEDDLILTVHSASLATPVVLWIAGLLISDAICFRDSFL